MYAGFRKRRKEGSPMATLEGLAFLQVIEADPRFEQRSLRPALRHLMRALAAAA